MMSKIELGSDVTEEWRRLNQDISNINENYVPFVSEVETFNSTMGKPNNYEPIIPEEKEWMFVYNFILEELEEYKHACETGDIVEVLDALCDIAYVSIGNGAMLHGLKDKLWPAYQEVQLSMAFTEDLDVFLADFGVSCTAGAVTAKGILDMPSQIVSDGMVLSTDYTLTARTSAFGSLIRGDSITVDGTAYTVRETMLLDDGKFVQLGIQKT